jgi:hypothetical protein
MDDLLSDVFGGPEVEINFVHLEIIIDQISNNFEEFTTTLLTV